jgi:hypothetical protein
MDLLVDYDNVLEPHRKLGLALLLERILLTLDSSGTALGSRVHARLYGGWYEGKILSRKAQFLAAELGTDFPRLFRPASSGSPMSVTAELALSLDIDRSSHFHHTFRRQTPPEDVRCHDPRSLGCSEAHCPALTMYEILRQGHCPQAGCTRDVEQLLYRASQKLVDTMLTADMIEIARRSVEPVIVVTSDDDLWPGLHSVLAAGSPAIQVHTRPGGIKRHPYARVGRVGYAAVELA